MRLQRLPGTPKEKTLCQEVLEWVLEWVLAAEAAGVGKAEAKVEAKANAEPKVWEQEEWVDQWPVGQVAFVSARSAGRRHHTELDSPACKCRAPSVAGQ